MFIPQRPQPKKWSKEWWKNCFACLWSRILWSNWFYWLGLREIYFRYFCRFNKMQVPLIRRTFPSLIIDDLLSVQPMTAPTGLVFAMKYRIIAKHSTETIKVIGKYNPNIIQK